jgi:hypothetical protein
MFQAFNAIVLILKETFGYDDFVGHPVIVLQHQAAVVNVTFVSHLVEPQFCGEKIGIQIIVVLKL